jgi:cobalt-zinc-cadmium efflux system outer membrane protein
MLSHLFAAAVLVVGPSPIQDTLRLSLDEARAIARSQAPSARAAQARLEVARGQLSTLATYPYNPRFEIKAAQLIDPGTRDAYEAILSQEIEWAGQWSLRSSARTSGSAAAVGEHAREIILFVARVETAFHTLLAATERERVHAESAALALALRDAVRAQLEAGDVSVLEANLAAMEAARAEADRRAQVAEVASASAELARLLGLDPLVALVPAAEPLAEALPETLEGALMEATENRSDVVAAMERLEEARARSSLARRQVIPSLGLAAVATGFGPGAPAAFGLRISFAIPTWNRNQGPRAEGTALVELRAAEEQDLDLAVRAEVSAAWERARAARAGLELYEAEVINQARVNRGLLERARGAGQLDLPTMLVLQSQVLRAELSYWDVWLQARIAEADLRAALGRRP